MRSSTGLTVSDIIRGLRLGLAKQLTNEERADIIRARSEVGEPSDFDSDDNMVTRLDACCDIVKSNRCEW